MRIMIVTPYLYYENIVRFTKNKTGYGLLLNEISKYGSKFNDIYVLTRSIGHELKIEQYKIISHTYKDILKSFNFKRLINGIQKSLEIDDKIFNRLKHIYYSIDAKYLEKAIMTIRPDIVHFHTVGYSTELGIEVCEKLNQRYLLTLHGLVGFSDSTPNHLKMSEYKLIKKLCERKIPITVISSGIKKRIIEDYGLIDADKIKVIVNGTNTNLGDNEDTLDIHKEYQIPKDSKIILYVGTISKNKNQTQFIKAFDLLNSRVKDNLYLLILGNIKDCPEIKKMIEEKELTKHIKLCGFVSKNKLTSYYKIADYNALVSLDEGFGLSIIEAFVYGVPTITFNDLDAVEDIYDERAVYLVNKRTDEDLAKGIENFVGIEWDTEFIRGYAKKFSLERMAEEYNRLYIELLKGNSDAENKQFKQN